MKIKQDFRNDIKFTILYIFRECILGWEFHKIIIISLHFVNSIKLIIFRFLFVRNLCYVLFHFDLELRQGFEDSFDKVIKKV